MIPINKQKELCDIIEEYAISNELIPRGTRLCVRLTLVPSEPTVLIIDETVVTESESKFLSLNAADSFVEFYSKNKPKLSKNELRLYNALFNNPSYSRFSKTSTLSDLVSEGSKDRLTTNAEIDFFWRRFRGVGRLSLNLVDNWFNSLNLCRCMKI